jgi:two-component system response regulator
MGKMDILLVEDNEDDVLLTMTALKRLGLAQSTAVCRDGAEALDYLAQRAAEEYPKLILLDLKLPKLDGLQVARRVKDGLQTRLIHVVMLTSSSRQADVTAALEAGADQYLTKSVEFSRFSEQIAQITRQFLTDPSKET